jgi:hypothetical protein
MADPGQHSRACGRPRRQEQAFARRCCCLRRIFGLLLARSRGCRAVLRGALQALRRLRWRDDGAICHRPRLWSHRLCQHRQGAWLGCNGGRRLYRRPRCPGISAGNGVVDRRASADVFKPCFRMAGLYGPQPLGAFGDGRPGEPHKRVGHGRLRRVSFRALPIAAPNRDPVRLLTALAAVGRTHLSVGSGFLAEQTGWQAFFIVSALSALPSLVLLWWLQVHGHFQSFSRGAPADSEPRIRRAQATQ